MATDDIAELCCKSFKKMYPDLGHGPARHALFEAWLGGFKAAHGAKEMTEDEYDDCYQRLQWLNCLIVSYRQEHNWDQDEDAGATEEMLRESHTILTTLLEVMGDRPERPPVKEDPEMPF